MNWFLFSFPPVKVTCVLTWRVKFLILRVFFLGGTFFLLSAIAHTTRTLDCPVVTGGRLRQLPLGPAVSLRPVWPPATTGVRRPAPAVPGRGRLCLVRPASLPGSPAALTSQSLGLLLGKPNLTHPLNTSYCVPCTRAQNLSFSWILRGGDTKIAKVLLNLTHRTWLLALRRCGRWQGDILLFEGQGDLGREAFSFGRAVSEMRVSLEKHLPC